MVSTLRKRHEVLYGFFESIPSKRGPTLCRPLRPALSSTEVFDRKCTGRISAYATKRANICILIAPIGGFDANIIAMIDLDEINKDLSLTQKIDLALKLNHYVVWKVTVMDIIILTAVSVGVSVTLIKTTQLNIITVMAIAVALCTVIEFVRIKTRRAKILHYTLQKARKAERLMQLYVDCCQLYGSEEDYASAQNLMEMLVLAKEEVSRRAEECEDMWFDSLRNIPKNIRETLRK